MGNVCPGDFLWNAIGQKVNQRDTTHYANFPTLMFSVVLVLLLLLLVVYVLLLVFCFSISFFVRLGKALEDSYIKT